MLHYYVLLATPLLATSPAPMPLTSTLRHCVRHFLLVTAALSFAALLDAQSPPTGTIEGRVIDPRRGEFLENARLTLEGSTQEVFTDATGQYRFTGVPAGTV